MSGEDVRKVQNLIERCLQLYMNQKEVIDTLSLEAKIEPSFTELVWQKLEEENREFFKAYYLRLMLKNQITAFNKLLEDQFQLMNKDYSSGIPSMPLTNGSNSTTLKQNSCFLPESGPISAMPNGVMRNGSSGGLVNGTSSGDHSIYGDNNGTTIKTESSYSSNADFAFCGNAFLESCQSIGDASGGSFSSSDLNGQPLNDALLDMESSSFGFLSQIPRNFSFSDLTEGFNQNTEVLENYGRSPFLSSEPNNFSDSTGGEHTG
uniref:Angiotensin-converting enzyme 2 n=1 Tax=Aegilops tauschii subsp. strangulata TaxID=200361 RepID=A0A453SNA2_AEGTS